MSFEKYDLVVCDGFGYVSYNKAAAESIFIHLSLRVGSKSTVTIITTNLGYNCWIKVFSDAVLTAAVVDCPPHTAILVDMNR